MILKDTKTRNCEELVRERKWVRNEAKSAEENAAQNWEKENCLTV